MRRRKHEAFARVTRTPGILMGIALGGLAEGILLRQVLQWHHLLSGTVGATTPAGLATNLRWEGVYAASALVLLLLALSWFWRAADHRRISRYFEHFVGTLLTGIGLYQVVEGVLDHQILGIHHVRQIGNVLPLDLIYLAVGVALLALGWLMMRGADARAARRGHR